jgi:hypothetical protein
MLASSSRPAVGTVTAAFVPEVRGLARAVPGQVAMSKLLRGIAAGWGAKKLGGGCLSTIVVFVVLWYLLGHVGIFR